MARNKRTIPVGPGLPPKEGVVIEVLKSAENWNEYILEDGTVIKLKPVLTEVLRVENEWAADGNPVYFLKSTQVLSVDAPENLRKKT